MKILSKKRKTAPLVADQPYARLYQAVVLRAVQDLAQRRCRNEAHEWLLSPASDYAFTTAGISAHSIRQLIV